MALHHILLHQVEYSSYFVNWSVMIKSLRESIKRNMFCHTTSYYHLCAVSLVISIACLLCTWHIKFNSEVSAPKKKKAAFNDIHEGSVDHYNWTVPSKGIEYRVGHCLSLQGCNEIHDQQNAPKVPNLLLMVFIAHNDIHGSFEEGYNPGRVGERLRAEIHFSHTSYFLQIPALTWTLN